MTFEDKFDVVFTHAVLQHNNEENIKEIFFRCFEALKNGGLLILQENIENAFSPEYWRNLIGSFKVGCEGVSAFEEILFHDFKNGGAGFVFRK